MVQVWDLATGQPVGEPLNHTTEVHRVATGVVDGRPVVLAMRGKTIKMWDLPTGQPDEPELLFPAEVNAVAITSDGRLVVGFGCEVAVLVHC